MCFIPLTIDGTGTSAGKSLDNLQYEAGKIIKALGRARIQCNFTDEMVNNAILKEKNRFNHIKKSKGRIYV